MERHRHPIQRRSEVFGAFFRSASARIGDRASQSVEAGLYHVRVKGLVRLPTELPF